MIHCCLRRWITDYACFTPDAVRRFHHNEVRAHSDGTSNYYGIVWRPPYGVKRIRAAHHPLGNHPQSRLVCNRHPFNFSKVGGQGIENEHHTGFRFSRGNKFLFFLGESRFGLSQYLPNFLVRRFSPPLPQTRHLVCRTCKILLPTREPRVQFQRETLNFAL